MAHKWISWKTHNLKIIREWEANFICCMQLIKLRSCFRNSWTLCTRHNVVQNNLVRREKEINGTKSRALPDLCAQPNEKSLLSGATLIKQASIKRSKDPCNVYYFFCKRREDRLVKWIKKVLKTVLLVTTFCDTVDCYEGPKKRCPEAHLERWALLKRRWKSRHITLLRCPLFSRPVDKIWSLSEPRRLRACVTWRKVSSIPLQVALNFTWDHHRW